MRVHRYLGLGAWLLALSLLGCGGKGDAELLSSAKDYLQKKDAKAATIQLKNLLQKDPSSAEARFLLGTALFESGDAAGAEIELRRAQELKHPDAAVVPLLARVMLRLKDYKKLTDQYAGLDLPDRQAAAALQTSVALAFAAQAAPDKARAAIAKALASSPEFEPALLAHARIKAAGGDSAGALAVLDQLLAKAPANDEAWQQKGDLLAQGKGDPAPAIEAYKKALAIRPDLAHAHASLISLYFVQQDAKAAALQFEAFKKVLPNDPLTRFYEAQLVFARGDYKQAREMLQELLRAVPDNAGVLHIAGAVEFKLDSLAMAETHLNRAVQMQPQFVAARRLLARVLLRSNQPAKAFATLKPVLDKPGADAETLTLAGQAQLLLGDAKAADSLFARATTLQPGDSKARTALAMSQLAKGNADSAFIELQTIAAADKGVSADMALISAHLKRNEFDAALKAIDALEKKQPANPVAADLRGRVFVARKDMASARQSFEKALALNPTYMPAITQLAALDFVSNKPDAAKARFETLLKTDPKNVQAYLGLAELKRRSAGTPAEVLKLLNDAVAANPSDPDPYLVLIQHHLSAGDAKAALQAAQAGVAANPGNVDLLDKQARTLMASGDMNQANSIFGKITAQQPDSTLGFQGLADINVASRDFPAAARNAKRALELDPHSMAAQKTSIETAIQLKRPQDALAVARVMQAQRPTDSLGFILEGDIEAAQDRWDAAAGAFRKALTKANPAQAPGRLHYALGRAKKAAEANRFGETWAAEHPKDTLFLLYLADTATTQGDSASAEKRYMQVLKQQPDNPLALNNVAWILIKDKKPGAVALAERAVKAAPGQASFMDTLSMALSNENQHARAIELQKKVVAQAPDAPGFRLTLAKIYLHSGDKAQARAELDRLAIVTKDFPGRSEVAPLIKTLGNS